MITASEKSFELFSIPSTVTQMTTSHFLNSENKCNIIIAGPGAIAHDLPDLLPSLCEKRNGESAPWHGLDFPIPRFRFVFSLYLLKLKDPSKSRLPQGD
jgi:hypothetical protein